MRGISFAAAVLAGSFALAPGARADVYNLPIGIVGTFSDGTALTGEFTLNGSGYSGSGYIDTLTGFSLGGTPIQGVEFVYLSTSPATPNVVTAYFDNYRYIISLTFEHSLGTPGFDPFVLDTGYAQIPNSAECYPYACAAYGPVDAPARERLVASGYANVPEPASAALLGAGLTGLLAVRRRQA
jgi:hypothetical protein